jgi:hypothetical protein
MKTIQILIALINKQKRYADDAPIEIPSITLSEKNKFEIRVSRARTELVLIDKEPDEDSNLLDMVISKVEELLRIFQEEQIEFKQIGYLIQTVVTDTTPNQKIKNLFNTENQKLSEIIDLTEQSEILFRNLRKRELEVNNMTLNTNSIIQIATNVKLPDNETLPLLIDYDTNTFPMSEENALETETIKGFLEKVREKQEQEVSDLIEAISEDGE